MFRKRKHRSFLDEPIEKFISKKSKNKEVYTVNPNTPFLEVIDKILDSRNAENAVAVVNSQSSNNSRKEE